MRLFHARFSARKNAPFWGIALLTCFSDVSLALDINQAADRVKAQPCKDQQSVEQVLDQSVRRRSQRDLGWHSFEDEGYVDIERAILINKGMEMRYRWRVFTDGSITPETERAKKLCDADD